MLKNQLLKKPLKPVLAITLSAALSMPALADVTLLVDDNIKVLAINGERITHGFFSPTKQEFKLPAGQNTITARYERLFELTRQEHDTLRSADISVQVELVDNSTYRLTMPNQPKYYQDAQEFVKSPSLAVVAGETVIGQATAAASSGLFGGFAQLFGKELFGSKDSQSPTPTQAAPAKTAPAGTLGQFMQLWLNANEEERQKIRQWIQQ